ncbi:hypothetical protein RUM43_008486 [Polyplax serrata]|uniref:Protein spire n=1 Tax=Polyplax serrata TaxID=468196 RepID=A0AAN8P5V1_POLSC
MGQDRDDDLAAFNSTARAPVMDDEDEDDILKSMEDDMKSEGAIKQRKEDNPYMRTGTAHTATALIEDEAHEFVHQALESYDLATQCPTRRASIRRHTGVACEGRDRRTSSVPPQSRPGSRQSGTNTTATPSPGSEELGNLGSTLPEMSWSRTSLQDDLFQSKTWAQECLSLTLEEIVHIRSVLTKAELEALPVDGHVKGDVEKRKVCFLCLKTRFSLFGPWGQKCRLCKRTVCAKCYCKMRIPTEHFAHVPVVALSPSLLSPSLDDHSDLMTRSMGPQLLAPEPRNSVGSAPSSPHLGRGESVSAPGSRVESRMGDGPISLPAGSPVSTASERRVRMLRSRTLGRQDPAAEKLKGLEMTVCHDCKAMVIQIIKSSRTSRTNAIRNLTLNLSPVY